MDRHTPTQRKYNMSRVKAKNTKPEILVRKLLHRLGYRFRLHRKDLPGKPDIVLPKYRTIIFVNGCFWHGHNCPKGKLPETNTRFWEEKITTNQKRDQLNREKLEGEGWAVLTIWECQIKEEEKIIELLSEQL